MLQNIAHRAVNLGHTTEAIGILDARIMLAMGLSDFGVSQNPKQVRRRRNLSGMRTHLMNALIKGSGRAHEGFQRHCSGKIGQVHYTPCAGHCECPNCRHRLGPIQQGETLFGRQLHWHKTGPTQRFPSRDAFALVESFSLADHDKRKMGERGEIAAGADRALLRNHRMDTGIQQTDQLLQQFEPDTAESLCENVGPQQKHGTHFTLAQGVADAARVAPHEIDLQLRKPVGGDPDIGELAEAGIDAIHGLAPADDLFNQRAALAHHGFAPKARSHA